MCVSCGCGVLDDKHGDERNITYSELKAAAEAANIDLGTLSNRIQEGLKRHSPKTDALIADVESMNQPLPGGQFADKLESTPYTE